MGASTPGTATILFTDLAGSTAQRAALGEERADALRLRHDALLTACVERAGGTVVKSMGDGILGAFGSASGALTAAVAIQRAAGAHNRRAPAEERLAIRIGLSVGDVAWTDGDCTGTPVVEAARLEAAAAPGTILCSDLVRIMARGRGDHRFEPVGFLELKGLPEPIPACRVLWEPIEEPVRSSAPLPTELRPSGRALLGRADALATAMDHLDRADPPSVVWLVGEPGIGKTRLAAELAQRSSAADALVLFGRCNEDLAVPYQPVVEALRQLVAHVDDDDLPARLGPDASQLSRLVPEIGQRITGLVPPVEHGSESDRHQLFEAVRATLAGLAAERRVQLVLDDLHWATSETVALVAHLLQRPLPPGSRLELLVTARDTAPDVNAQLAHLIDNLTGSRRSLVLRLGGLTVDELLPATDDRAAATVVHERTAGNPLFVEVLLRQAATEGHLGSDRDVGAVVRRRVDTLDEASRALLSVASLLGLEFDVRALAEVLGQDEFAVIEQADQALEAGLLEAADANTYRWVHAVVREVLASAVSPARRARWHSALTAVLQRRGSPAAVVAHHAWEAQEVLGAAVARACAEAAGEAAERMLSYAEAARHHGRALTLTDRRDEPGPWCRTAYAHGRNLAASGEHAAAAVVLADAVETACLHGLGALALEIAVQLELATWYPGIAGDRTAALVERALATAADAGPELRARALAALSRALVHAGQLERAEPIGRQAVALARRSGDRLALARALVTASNAYFYEPDWPPVVTAMREAIELIDTDRDDPFLVAETANYACVTAAGTGDLELFRRARPTMERFADHPGLPFWRAVAAADCCSFTLAEGDLDAAERWLDVASSEFESLFGDGSASSSQGFMVRREQGRLGELLPAVRLLARLGAGSGQWRPGLAALYGELGFAAECRAEIDAVAADGWAGLPTDGTRMLAATMVTEAVLGIGHLEAAAWLHRFYRPLAGTAVIWPGSGGFIAGAVDTYLAGLAGLLGDHDGAVAHARVAMALTERMGWHLWHAHAEAGMAAALAGAGRAEDAAAVFDAVTAQCHERGFTGLLARVERLRAQPPYRSA